MAGRGKLTMPGTGPNCPRSKLRYVEKPSSVPLHRGVSQVNGDR
jgi:hypothetical protein